jgi:hypothetical protein
VEPTREEVERGEGTIGRRITLRIDKPVWRRPTLPAGTSLPQTLETGGGFWTFHGTKEQRFVVEGREWIEVGKTYLALFNYMDPEYAVASTKPPADADPAWGPLVWLGLDGRITSVPAGDVGPELAKQLRGASVAEAAALLAATRPDPFAVPYMAEDPALRYQHTFSAREHATAVPAESAPPPTR